MPQCGLLQHQPPSTYANSNSFNIQSICFSRSVIFFPVTYFSTRGTEFARAEAAVAMFSKNSSTVGLLPSTMSVTAFIAIKGIWSRPATYATEAPCTYKLGTINKPSLLIMQDGERKQCLQTDTKFRELGCYNAKLIPQRIRLKPYVTMPTKQVYKPPCP